MNIIYQRINYPIYLSSEFDDVELEVNYVEDTPKVIDNCIYIKLRTNKPSDQIRCLINRAIVTDCEYTVYSLLWIAMTGMIDSWLDIALIVIAWSLIGN